MFLSLKDGSPLATVGTRQYSFLNNADNFSSDGDESEVEQKALKEMRIGGVSFSRKCVEVVVFWPDGLESE